MKESLNKLEECLIASKNPVLKYLDSGTPFDQKAFENALDSFQLEPHEDLNALYAWKAGVKKELVDSNSFNYRIFNRGSHIDYTLAIETYQLLALQDKEIFENRFFPFLLAPILGFESPMLIDLSKKSKTYGMIFYDSPSTGTVEPTSIYDSLYSMIETIIACYQQGVYSITKEGFFEADFDRYVKISAKMNKKSEYWDDCC